jgi:hypothetical protein
MLFQRAILLLIFALPPGGAVAQVLNMSHDLVPLGIASQNMAPNNPSLDSRPLFQAALQYAQKNPVETLTVDPGAYYLLSATQGNAVLIASLSGTIIDLAGSTIYFLGPQLTSGLQLFYCSNVTLENFQLDFINPPYTHVQLTSVDTVNRILHYQTLAGWPDPMTLYNESNQSLVEAYWAAFFRNGSIVPGTSRTVLQAPLANQTITINDPDPWGQSSTLATLQAGDTIVVTARGGGPPILVWEGNGITLFNIAIYGAGETPVQLFQTSNSTVDTVKIMPRPGSGLIGSAGDSIHFLWSGPNNLVQNCFVSRTMDDGLAVENYVAATVVSQPGSQQLTVTRSSYVRFPNGTAMAFYDPTTDLESHAGTIVSQSPADSVAPAATVTLTFDSSLPTVAAGTFLTLAGAAQRGQGSTIQDNIVEDTYGGRGIWLSGANGFTIQRNVVRRTSNSGIIVDAGVEYPPSSGITITNNAIEQPLGPQAPGAGLANALGGIQLVGVNPDSSLAVTPSNTNITIANNYIADSNLSGMWIGELNGGTLNNNLVIRSSQDPAWEIGAPMAAVDLNIVMQDALEPVVIGYSTSVVETGDTISATSRITAPLTFNPLGATTAAGSSAGSFALQTAINGFAWKAVSDSSWLVVNSGPLGAGNGAVQYSLAPNTTGATRTGHITVAGETFTVTQTAGNSVPCNVTGDQTTSVADLQMMLNEALGTAPAANDLNGDGVVNVVDIQKVIEALFGLGCQ